MDAIKDVYLNPSFQSSKFRIEFRIPKDKVFSSKMKIQKLGFKNTQNSAPELLYSISGGALSMVKSISLKDKGVELDSCKNCGGFNNFKTMLGVPYEAYGKDQEYASRSGVDMRSSFAANGGTPVQRIQFKAKPSVIGVGENGKDGGVDVSFFLPMLSSVESIDTTLFDDLRLVIELESSALRVVTKDNVSFENINSVLKLQEIVDPQLKAQMSAKSGVVSWEGYEHERFILPAVVTTSTTRVATDTNVRLSGLRNKYITKILIRKELQTDTNDIVNNNASIGEANNSSLANMNEKIQFRVNGADLFPEGGLGDDKTMDILAVTADAWGEYSLVPYGNEYGKGPGVYDANVNNWSITEAVRPQFIQNRAYIGAKIETFCSDFSVIYTRSTLAAEVNGGATHLGNSSYTNLAQNAHLYYGVIKQLIIKNGSYAVKYMMSP